MAKKQAAPINKSAEIRRLKDENPEWGPSQIAAELNKKGVDVKPQFVSTILSGARRKAGIIGRRGRAPAPATYQDLILARELVSVTGSIANAKAALDTLAKLMGQG